MREPGLHNQLDQRGSSTEHQKAVQIDTAIDVERLIGVIPKPNAEQTLILP